MGDQCESLWDPHACNSPLHIAGCTCCLWSGRAPHRHDPSTYGGAGSIHAKAMQCVLLVLNNWMCGRTPRMLLSSAAVISVWAYLCSHTRMAPASHHHHPHRCESLAGGEHLHTGKWCRHPGKDRPEEEGWVELLCTTHGHGHL